MAEELENFLFKMLNQFDHYILSVLIRKCLYDFNILRRRLVILEIIKQTQNEKRNIKKENKFPMKM